MARILVVEDALTASGIASGICKAANHLVMTAENGMEALMMLDMEAFDLVLTDASLPRMDGITLTSMIRASEEEYADIPIIGMAAETDVAGQQALRAADVDEVVTKPFTAEILMVAVVNWLESGRTNVTLLRESSHNGAHLYKP